MKLHEDKFAFLNIINLIHEASSIRTDILEKDYYVTLLLRELAGKQVTLPAYFKGGTALYKAQKSIRRFSEDIDLTVCIDNCSNSQAKKRLEMATKKYQALPRTSRKDLEDDRKGSITTVYDYTPLVGVDSDDPLQRFGYVKVEGTSFTVSEPFTPLEIEPILYTYATEEQRNILQSQYNVAPFMINTIRLERIFADKVLPFYKSWYESTPDCAYLLHTEDGKHFTYRNYYDSYFHPLMEQLKINRTPHCCRHTCVSMLAEAGVDQTIIKKIVGHSGAMTLTEKVYTHFDIKELVDAINRI